MLDEPVSPQQHIDDAANALGKTPTSDVQNTDVPVTTIAPLPVPETTTPDPLPVPPMPTPTPMIVPAKEKDEQKDDQQTDQPKKPAKKKAGKGILIATLLFFIFTLPIAIYYVTQSPQFAEIRSKAAAGSCIKTGVSNACSSFNCSNFSTENTCSVNGSMCCTWKATVVPTATVKPCGHIGESCCSAQGSQCYSGLSCSNGMCKSATGSCGNEGETCCTAQGSQCYSGLSCTSGTCKKTQATATATPTTSAGSGTTCPNSSAACKPGGSYYYEWQPNHVICGTCDRTNNFNTCGIWEGEAGVWKNECCGGTCSGSYPWTFENQCLSTKTSNREACFHVEADCNRVQPCNSPAPTSPINQPVTTSVPTATPTIGPTNTPTTGPTNTPVATPTPTTTNNTPVPGTCDASCDTNSNCESGLSCVTSTGVKRCRNATCPDESDCSCPSATPTTYFANNTPIPTTASLIATAPTTIPTNQPTPKIPVAGVGPGFIGIISVVGSIFLLLIGLAL